MLLIDAQSSSCEETAVPVGRKLGDHDFSPMICLKVLPMQCSR